MKENSAASTVFKGEYEAHTRNTRKIGSVKIQLFFFQQKVYDCRICLLLGAGIKLHWLSVYRKNYNTSRLKSFYLITHRSWKTAIKQETWKIKGIQCQEDMQGSVSSALWVSQMSLLEYLVNTNQENIA